MAPEKENQLTRRLAGQGLLLGSGLTAAQLCAFARNGMLGYMLSKGDFGVAATLTLTLQLLESLSDLASDRMIVQAEDGDSPELLRAAHSMLVLRGLVTGLAMWLAAPLVAALFHLHEATHAFQWIAIIPVVKGFVHLDMRRQQRRYRNTPVVVVEVLPQIAALVFTYPVVLIAPGYDAVVWLALLQALVMAATSHATAVGRWGLSASWPHLRRLLVFGWPVLLSAVPMIAVYQLDRVIVGRFLGMEALAAYTVAFMITMAPGVIVVKIANSLMLPLLAEVKGEPDRFERRFALCCEALVGAAGIYLVLFGVAGEALVRLAFGPNYGGLGALVLWLALVWALRILALVSGTALMAHGDTRPLLAAVCIRSTTLVLALSAAVGGHGVVAVAAMGALGEVMSVGYLTWRVGRLGPGLARTLAMRSLLLVPAFGIATAVPHLAGAGSVLSVIAATLAASATLAALTLLASVRLRRTLRGLIARRQGAAEATV